MATEAANAMPLAPDLSKASEKTLKIENTEKRDTLVATEKNYQKAWAEAHLFESDAPTTAEIPFGSVSPAALREQEPKFMGTMAYPYRNGVLHAGHSFTLSKVEFATGYARMQGKRALFPMGFHCTGMAIKACADKLVREVEMFGRNFEAFNDDTEADGPQAPTQSDTKTDVTRFSSKKGKTTAKSVKAKYQFRIMLSVGVSISQIHLFADPYHWVRTFPSLGKQHLSKLGLRIDWRRSFVTTDANPYYDSFVRWQMNKLKELGKIKFGKRYTVYSPKDGQPCLDHDRSSGEGINTQDYTAVKLKVLEWLETAVKATSKIPDGSRVYFVAATLRPETMYGQTCCFVGPDIAYGIYRVSDDEYFLVSERSARNIAFQGIFAQWGAVDKITDILRADVIGTLVNAPLSINERVRVLPMETVKFSKGTGVVTSVPSDSPDDYATIIDLTKKADYYGIKKEWVERDIIPIIETPKYGSLIAPSLVQSMKINSPKDPKLLEAKEEAYKEGFYHGTLIYGEFKGRPVSEAKGLVKEGLIISGDTFNYAEPDGVVISRSGDECVAAHLDQWYLNYGTTEKSGGGEWCAQVLRHVQDGLNTFFLDAKNQFEQTLGWLSQWACARSYGLGSKLPWDPQFLVESLSDSTIYPCYYTVAHYLHTDLFGKERGIGDISPDEMTDEVWDYVFARKSEVKSTVQLETLQSMRREFEYWYPLDLRVSGKDLMTNHLTFFLYIHIAMWPQEFWPQGVRLNGHLLLNGHKMSKNANFEESVANSIILKLYELRKWCEFTINEAHLIDSVEEYRKLCDQKHIKNMDHVQRQTELGFWDYLFANEMAALVQETKSHYDKMHYKNAIKSCFYDFTSARDFYREFTKSAGIGMNHSLVRQYIEAQALLITPIAPHWAEYIWLEVLQKPTSIQNARFPELTPVDSQLTATQAYIRSNMSNITSAESAQQRRLAKGKTTKYNPNAAKKLTVFFAKEFPAWQGRYMTLLQETMEKFGAIDVRGSTANIDKKDMKKAMPLVQSIKKRLDSGADQTAVFERKLQFDEADVLDKMIPALKQVIRKCDEVILVAVQADIQTQGLPPVAQAADPGNPVLFFENV
ncbi:unnamed protein product [Periconia digitata]|uniref:leucine--tRNA ligase n=1 Tax=Periconia digitata TaxID=1303443 RepID=A0A9W4UJY5_9PLEO|nr:unnamed protein product [Periconia digitata]